MSIWDFLQKPRDPAVALRDKSTVPSFRSLKSCILSISWLLFLLSTDSSSNLLSLPQPMDSWAIFHLLESARAAPEGLQQGTRQAADGENQWCWWTFSDSPELNEQNSGCTWQNWFPHLVYPESSKPAAIVILWVILEPFQPFTRFLLCNNFTLQLVQWSGAAKPSSPPAPHLLTTLPCVEPAGSEGAGMAPQIDLPTTDPLCCPITSFKHRSTHRPTREEYGCFSAHTRVLPSHTLGSHWPYW